MKENRLESLMDIAPPLTSTDTRSKQTVAMAIADSQQRHHNTGYQKRGYASHDVGSGRFRDEPKKTSRPPRFREHEVRSEPETRDPRQTKRYSSQRQRNTDVEPAGGVSMVAPVPHQQQQQHQAYPQQMVASHHKHTAGPPVPPAQSLPRFYPQQVHQSECS